MTQNVYVARPKGSDIGGFVFTDLESFQAEYEHRLALFGAEEFELQMIDGDPIDRELFSSLGIDDGAIVDWFDEVQHLTADEKVGLRFLTGDLGYDLPTALECVADGLSIFRSDKTARKDFGDLAAGFQEFHFADATWCGSVAAP